jgi:hypothetical protein
VNVTSTGIVAFKDYKSVEADLPSASKAPLSIPSLYLPYGKFNMNINVRMTGE